MPDITLVCRYDNATIKINGITHVIFRTSDYRGLQTWLLPDRWCIQLVLVGAAMRLEYDSADKFSAVLALIERAIEQ